MDLYEIKKKSLELYGSNYRVLRGPEKSVVWVLCKKHDFEWGPRWRKYIEGRHICKYCRNEKAKKNMGTKLTQEQWAAELKKIHPHYEVIGPYRGIIKYCKTRCTLCGYTWDVVPNNMKRPTYKCPSCQNTGKGTHKDTVVVVEKRRKKPEIENSIDELFDDYRKKTRREYIIDDGHRATTNEVTAKTTEVEGKSDTTKVRNAQVNSLVVPRIKLNLPPIIRKRAMTIQPQVLVGTTKGQKAVADEEIIRLDDDDELKLAEEDEDIGHYRRLGSTCEGCIELRRQPWRRICTTCGQGR